MSFERSLMYPYYPTSPRMNAPTASAQQYLPAAVPQQPQASRLQQPTQPVFFFARGNCFYTFEGTLNDGVTQPGHLGIDINGQGCLKCFSDNRRTQLNFEFSGRIERGQPVIAPKQFTDAETDAMPLKETTETAVGTEKTTTADTGTGEEITYRDAATQTEDPPAEVVIPAVILDESQHDVILSSSSRLTEESANEIKPEPKKEEIPETQPASVQQEAKAARQIIENPLYAKDNKTVVGGTITLSGLEKDGQPAKFMGSLKKIKGSNSYRPAQQHAGVIQWGEQIKFTGEFNHQGIPTTATRFILGNGYEYFGAVNEKLQLHGEGVLKKMSDANWSLASKFNQDKLIGNTEIIFDKKGTQYSGPVDDQYRPHGEGKLTKPWHRLTLVFNGVFSAGQWQENQRVDIEKLGSFIGQPGDEINPNPGQITFLNGAKAEQVLFSVNEICVTDMIMNKGAAQLCYSGLIDAQGYPAGDGVIQICWREELLGRPSEYSITGTFGGENITTKKQHYSVAVGEVVHPSVQLKDFWLFVEEKKRKNSKSESSVDSAFSSASSSLTSSPSKKEATQYSPSASSSSIILPPKLSENAQVVLLDFNTLPPIAMPVRQKIIGNYTQGKSFLPLVFPVGEQDNSFQLFVEGNKDKLALGECCWRTPEVSMHPDDYYFVGQVKMAVLGKDTVYLPHGYGVLFMRSGHVFAGEFIFDLGGDDLPKVVEGCAIWHGGEAFVTINRSQNLSANWLNGEKPVKIYEANTKQSREVTCRQQLDEIIKALLWHIDNRPLSKLGIYAKAC